MGLGMVVVHFLLRHINRTPHESAEDNQQGLTRSWLSKRGDAPTIKLPAARGVRGNPSKLGKPNFTSRLCVS